MVLLSQTMRAAAFTGSTDTMFTRIAGRQGGQWADQTVRRAFPTARPRTTVHDLNELNALRARGLLSDSEFERLRARLGV